MNTCLITGANRGIGLYLTKRFVEEGYQVIGTARHIDKAYELKKLADKCSNQFILEQLDLEDFSSISALKDRLSGRIDKLDILINNAGILIGSEQTLEQLSFEGLEKMFRVNALAPLKMVQNFLDLLRKSALPRVINMSSRMGSIGDNTSGGCWGYRTSKAALNMLTKNLAIEKPEIISVVMHPGWVKTDMGGAQAPLSVEESTLGLFNVIEKLTAKDSGRFYNYRGELLPW